MVSDRVVYRALLRGAERLLDTVSRALNLGRSGGQPHRRRVWDLAVRCQRLATDPRTPCALVGVDAVSWRSFLHRLRHGVDDRSLALDLADEFRLVVRQYARDVRLATDAELFGAGGLAIRDEIELVAWFVETHCPGFPLPAAALRELEEADARLRPRLRRYLTGDGAAAGVGPADGFDVPPGTIPRRFWWRHLRVGAADAD